MLLARNASGMFRRQATALRERSAALSESYRLLEESSLEAIESLNATVEAKDPYATGHSLRVQRISLSSTRTQARSKRRSPAASAPFVEPAEADVVQLLGRDPELLRDDLVGADDLALAGEKGCVDLDHLVLGSLAASTASSSRPDC
jgi:hypothetical protein